MATHQNDVIHSHIPFRVQIGVTGHRNLILTEQLTKSVHDALTTQVKKILNWNEKKYTPLIFSFMSPLAEGADRLVAKQAISLLNATLEVVLPMSKEEYLLDFTSPESLDDFEKLLRQAADAKELIKKPMALAYPGKDPHEQKILAYEKTGHYVVDNSDILIAIWDGKPAESAAGTGDIVGYARKKNKPLIIISSVEPYTIIVELGSSDIKHRLSKIEMFNGYHIGLADENLYIKNLNSHSFPLPQTERLHEKNKEFVLAQLMPWYVRANTIAKTSQKRYQFVGLFVYLLSPIAVALVALGILVNNLAWLFFSLEFLILFAVYFFITMADRAKIHKKWIECRYLAEHIRCAIFFAACGFKPAHVKNHMYFRTPHQADNWAAEVFNEIIMDLPDVPVYKDSETSVCVDYIKNFWIEDQLNYHKKKIDLSGSKGGRLEQAGKIVFFGALIAAFIHVLLIFTGIEGSVAIASAITIFVAISMPALGASLGAIRIHREYSRLEKQSQRMVHLLEALNNEIHEIESREEFMKFLVKTQEIMLRDVQGWLTLMELSKIESV